MHFSLSLNIIFRTHYALAILIFVLFVIVMELNDLYVSVGAKGNDFIVKFTVTGC